MSFVIFKELIHPVNYLCVTLINEIMFKMCIKHNNNKTSLSCANVSTVYSTWSHVRGGTLSPPWSSVRKHRAHFE